MQTNLRLYAFGPSGHSHRAELFLSLLGLGFDRIEMNLPAGQHKQPSFLAKNPLGQVPVLEDGELTVADSNAILVYLASRYDPQQRWLPREPLAMARVQRWLSIAAGPLAMGAAGARAARLFGTKLDVPRSQAIAHQLLLVMEAQLGETPFLTGDDVTLADLALYSYTAVAPEGGVSLADHAAVRSWLARIESLPGFLPMPRSGLAS